MIIIELLDAGLPVTSYAAPGRCPQGEMRAGWAIDPDGPQVHEDQVPQRIYVATNPSPNENSSHTTVRELHIMAFERVVPTDPSQPAFFQVTYRACL